MVSNSLALSKTKIKSLAFLKLCAKYFVVFLMLLVSSFATIGDSVHTTFSFGLYFALLTTNLNFITLSVSYVISYFIANPNLIALYCALNISLVGVLLKLIYKKINKKINKYVLMAFALIGNATYIYFNIVNSSYFIPAIISVLLGFLFLWACVHFITALSYSGITFKLNLDEVISGSVVLMVFAMGFSALNFYGIELIKIVSVICIILATYIFPTFYSLYIGSVLGIGATIFSNNLNYIAVFVVFALLATAFKSNNKIFSCIAIILCEIVFGLYFEAYETFDVLSVISVIIGEIIVLVLPNKFINTIIDKLGGIKEKVAIRNIINHSKEGLCNRMNEIANVFSEMDKVFRSMVKGVLPVNDAKKMLTAEVIDKVGKENQEIMKLLRSDSNATKEVFSELIDIGFERGKVTLLDVPQFLTSRGIKVNHLINTINQLLNSYKHYSIMVNNMDTSRTLIADQLSGVSNILKNLAKEVNLNITFDLSKETRILEDLKYKEVYCQEAIVYEQNAHVLNATLIVKESDVKPEIIEKVVSKVVGSKMKIISQTPSSVSGCTLVMLKTKPNYDIVFGSASSGKSGEAVNGDTHSIIKIDEGKFMVALCDGMGSGKKANLISSLSISLIENFYKAGFDNEIILNSVNKLLSQNSEETFSALDVCVIDTRYGICDFIKLGSPEGFIKHKNSTEVVESCGLPMGVLEEMQPHIAKKVLTDFDIIILVSDGITQAFENNNVSLQTFINNLDSTNPQTIADEILDRAVDLQNGVCSDDMTVIAVRVYPVV